MKKTSIKIVEIDSKTKKELGSPSKITLKEYKKAKRKLTIRNNGEGWVQPKAKRISITIRDSIINPEGKPEVTMKLREGNEVSMTFLDLCDIYEIMKHTKDLGMNLMDETEVIK
jgi:hypothetical protein